MKILHIGSAGAIMIPFVEFVKINFNTQEHVFMLSSENGHLMPEAENVINLGKLPRALRYAQWLREIYRAEKVILHGLFDSRLIFLLMLQPWLLQKCYWVIWGGDLYDHQLGQKNFKWKLKQFLKQRIVHKFGHFITHIRGDYELAKKWYGAKGQWHECFLYTSNLYRDYPIEPKPHDGIHILLGNSATPTNNHLDALEKLRPFAHENIKIYCPLSYGDASYGDFVERTGIAIFGTRFIALRDFMPFDKYLEFLSDIDIAIFNHNRQQGIGNITTLLGLGKTVYMNRMVTSFRTFQHLGIEIGDIENFSVSHKYNSKNAAKVTEYFSLNRLKEQWHAIFK